MNILILKVSAIGDVIHTLPVIFYFKHCCPSVKISWVVQKKAADLLLNQPFIDNVFVLPDKFLKIKNWKSTLKILKELRKTKWNAILDLQGIHKTSLLLLFLKGKKYGFCPDLARSKFSTWFTDKHVCAEFKNIIQKNLAVASEVVWDSQECQAAFSCSAESCPAGSCSGETCSGGSCSGGSCPGVQELKKDFVFNFNESGRQAVNEWLSTNKINKFILLCPNTTWQTKHWPEELWVQLISEFTKQNATHKVALAGQAFGAAAQKIAQACKEQSLPIAIVPAWDLNTTAYLISKTDLLIAPDTGLLHLADFLNVTTIGIFGPTSKDLQGPFLKNENIINAIQVYNFQDSNDTNESNFKKTTVSKSRMYKLKPGELLEKVLQILKNQK